MCLALTAPVPLVAQQPTHADLIYKTTPQRPLTLDLYLPEGAANLPLVIYIHGGGWKDGSPKNPPLRHLLGEGFAMASISYRFSHEAKFPAQLEDVRDAVGWLVANAPKFGYDPSRIALVGGSAGGHLAMLGGISLARDSLPVRAVVSFFGPSDFILRSRTQPGKTQKPGGSVYELLGGTPAEHPEAARAASPAMQVDEHSPPLLLFHGTGDKVVYLDQSERMAAAYRDAGRPVELLIKEEAGHKISNFADPTDRTKLREFLASHLMTQKSELSLSEVFSDHAVLQCEKPIAIWGAGRAKASITVEIAGESADTRADDSGRWRVTLPPLPAGGPHELIVRSGDDQIRRTDILLGEVWLCAGQSNMNWGLIATEGGEEELAKLAATPTDRVRLLCVPQEPADEPQTRLYATWTPCTPETARDFSAIGYRAGRALETALDRPIGLIHASWGGTPAEAWLPRDILESHPRYAEAFPRFAAALANAKDLDGVRRKAPAASYNGIINPIVPYTLRGILWYQGEANIGRPHLYASLFRTLIETWRDRWAEPSLPFLFVQLPRYAAPKTPLAWAELRAAQESVLDLPATAMAVTIDCGDPNNIHPRDKAPIADRLARLALHRVYDKTDAIADSPRIASVEFQAEGSARVKFDHAGNGLYTQDGGHPLGFELAGADGVFHTAEVVLEAGGTAATVRSPVIPHPKALRYAWANAPAVNLVSSAALPLAPYHSVFKVESSDIAWPNIPERRFNVRDFAATGDGSGNDSPAIQAAIDKAHAEGGGTVFFPPGRYPAASIRAKSRVRIELDPAAEIFGAPGPVFDLPIERPGDVYQDMGMSYPELSIIWGDGVEDFEIRGGKINGGSITRHDPEPGMGNKVVAFINSRRLRFDSITHETGGHFVYNLNGCEDITLKNIVIGLPRGETALKPDGNMELHTRDSVSLVSCHSVHVTGCHFTGSGDDTIGIKNHYALNRKGSCKDILVEDCVLETGCNALQIGSETAGDFTNIAFRDITIRRAMKAALSVTSNDGGHVRDVRFEDIRITGAATPIFLAVTDRLRTGEPGVTVGSISGVTFKNIDIRDGRSGWHGRPHPITLVGHPASWIRNVWFENVEVVYPGGEPEASPKYELAYTKRYQPDRIGQRPASALYAREVAGLQMRGVSFAWEKPDPRPAVVGMDWKDVSLRDISFSNLPTGREELILDGAIDVTIERSRPLPDLSRGSFPEREIPYVWRSPESDASQPRQNKRFPLILTEPKFAVDMVWLAPGTFRMGSPEEEPRRQPDEQVREVAIKDGFWISAHEITQRQWFAIMGTNPSRFQNDPELPVHNVSFNDAMEFCHRLTLRERAVGRLPEGWSYSLPTEAQWEYACRAGTTWAYANEPVDDAGWHDGNTVQRPVGASPMPVGLKKPNAWGLHDMHGNVWEWCLDDDESSPAAKRKVIRGGSWRTGPFSLRSANRASLPPTDALHDLGFRILLSAPELPRS